MRISDWSSDVCSSDLFGDEGDPGAVLHIKIERVRTPIEELDPDLIDSDRFDQFTDIHAGSPVGAVRFWNLRSEEHTSELQSLMRISYAVFCLKKKKQLITRKSRYYI